VSGDNPPPPPPRCSALLSVPPLSDLEKSVEEIQKESTVNHKLVTAQELEEKSTLLRKLGETLTELKSESPSHFL